MLNKKLSESIEQELNNLKSAGRFKVEREITSPQDGEVTVDGKNYLMFASNNYLGLANHPRIIAAAQQGIEKYGFGLSSVRFISGTEKIHRELEMKLSEFLGVEDAILYSTNFMANLGFFASITNETLGFENYTDVIYSDELNHASIIDAFKLCKKESVVKRIYPHGDVATLEKMLEEDKGKNYRFKFIVTDGVFSMEGYLADLSKLRELAQKYDALLFVDDAHGVGVLGKSGAGTPEHLGLHGKIDVLSGTFGKALGGALGGYIAGPKDLIEFLRQKSRTYIFSNSLPPSVVTASLEALELISEDKTLSDEVLENAKYFREKAKSLGLQVLEGEHPIAPIMLGGAKETENMSKELFAQGIYVTGLWFPVVPEGTARLRFQLSALHTKEMIDQALDTLSHIKNKETVA